jgi:hypothetical protein
MFTALHPHSHVCVPHANARPSELDSYAMMRWWQERAGVMVNVHLSQALDVITSGELHTRFFWQFVKNEAPVENNYDRQKQLVAFDREAASAATCPINMRYLVCVWGSPYTEYVCGTGQLTRGVCGA